MNNLHQWSPSDESIRLDGAIDLDLIQHRVASHDARIESLQDGRYASVAIILRQLGGRQEILLIERATRESDPWSAQIAFPGGKIDPADASARAAAERETMEEISLAIRSSEYVGRLDDVLGVNAGIRPGVVLSAFVYRLDRDPELRANEEVEEILWVPLEDFFQDHKAVTMEHWRRPGLQLAGVRVGDKPNQVIWGLSFRVMAMLFKTAGLPFRDWARPID